MDQGPHGFAIVMLLYTAVVFAPYLVLWAVHVTVLCAVEAANEVKRYEDSDKSN